MATKAEANNLICCLCRQTYTNPVLLSPCGHSFDRQCILRYTACPEGFCNAPVSEQFLLPNDVVKNLIDRNNQTAKCTYEIFLLDTSTSMWFSDFFFGLIGVSRFQMAIKFLTEVFEQRWNSTANQISLVTFDTNPIEQFSFETARQHHVWALQKLKPNGSYTALFDAFKFCLERFEKVNQITPHSTAQCLYILTDGGDNFSSSGTRQHYVDYIKERSGKLNIIGHIIQVGDKNLPDTKKLSEDIDYRFHHFNSGNTPEFIHSFISSTSHYSKNLEKAVEGLPNACTTPVQPVSNKKRTGVLA